MTVQLPGAPLGAAPEQWSLLERSGIVEDLLPVVCDATAKIAERSKLKDIGKTPSRYTGNDEAVGIPGWTRHKSTPRQVAGWSTDGRLGICVQTRRVRAIDIDVPDAVQAQRVLDMVSLLQGTLPRRYRTNSGKCLLAFDMPGDFTKRIIRTPHGIIEFLADGQQFIAHGTHTSGVPYAWDGLEVIDLMGWPQVTPAEFETVWQGLADVFGDAQATVKRTVLPSVARSALDMYGDPVVAFLKENDWIREFDRDGRIHVRCPWEAEHTSDSGPTASSWFPAGVGGFHQGHYRCLHAHCAERTDDQFMHAIGYHDAMFDVVEAPTAADGTPAAPPEPWPVFARDKQGRIESSMDNAVRALGCPGMLGARLAFDEFKDAVMIAWGDAAAWRPLTDVDNTELRVALERRGFKAPGKDLVRDAVDKVALDNRFDSARDWARSLQWDGTPRVASFFPRLFNVPDTPYARAVGRYLWTALAGRALEPGVKADMVPVLISGQGTRKTQMVEALAPEEGAFVEINLEVRDDNLARSLRGKLVAELAELRGLASRDSEAIKAWVSRRHEEWIPKWREHATRFARRFIAIGTGNNEAFLDDPTGERRWLPLKVGSVDVDSVRAERDQLWAEGVARFDEVGIEWQDAQALAEAEHEAFKVSDVWEDAIVGWLSRNPMEGVEAPIRGNLPVRMRDVLVGALNLDMRHVERKQELRAGRVLRTLGFEKGVWHAAPGGPCKAWFAGPGSTLFFAGTHVEGFGQPAGGDLGSLV